MVNYGDGKIYKIVSNQTDQVYFGSTTNSLARRISEHRAKYKSYQKGNGAYVTSFELSEISRLSDYFS